MGGPIWSAPIQDQEWVTSILADVKSMKERYPAYDRISEVCFCNIFFSFLNTMHISWYGVIQYCIFFMQCNLSKNPVTWKYFAYVVVLIFSFQELPHCF